MTTEKEKKKEQPLLRQTPHPFPPLPPKDPQKITELRKGKKGCILHKTHTQQEAQLNNTTWFHKTTVLHTSKHQTLTEAYQGMYIVKYKNMGYTYTQDKNLCTHTCTSAYVTYILTLLGVVTEIISSPITIAK